MKKTIAIAALAAVLFTACSPAARFTVTEMDITTKGGKISFKPLGKPRPLGDTTLRGFLIQRRKP